jgi:hypothetical protein
LGSKSAFVKSLRIVQVLARFDSDYTIIQYSNGISYFQFRKCFPIMFLKICESATFKGQ